MVDGNAVARYCYAVTPDFDERNTAFLICKQGVASLSCFVEFPAKFDYAYGCLDCTIDDEDHNDNEEDE